MRLVRIGTFLAALGWTVVSALGQGLYGAPQMLPLAPAAPLNATPAYLPPSGFPPPNVDSANTSSVYPSQLAQYPQYSQYPQYPQPQAAPQAGYVPGPVGANPAGLGYTPAPPGPGYYNGYPGFSYRVASANPAVTNRNAMGTVAVPNGQPLPPIAQPQGPQPVYPTTNSGPVYEQPGCGSGGPWCGGGLRSFGQMFAGNGDAGCPPKWYASGSGLLFVRDDPNGVTTTVDSTSLARLMQTSDARVDWRGGYEAKIGAYLSPTNDWAIEGDYWTIDRFRGLATASAPGGTVSTPLVVDDVTFGEVNGDLFFNGASQQSVLRIDRVQSMEVNLVYRLTQCDPCCTPLFDVSVSAGPRYFQFDDLLTFGSMTGGGDTAFLNERTLNTLIGAQVGVDAGFHATRCIRLFATPKIGLYNNHIETRFDAVSGAGDRAVPTTTGGAYPVYADKNAFSFMAQIDTGVDWEFAPRWTAFVGYRLVAATGIGLADHQLPSDVADFTSLGDVKSNGDLLVHGAFAGLKVQF